MPEQFALCWSKRLHEFRTEPLKAMLQRNLRAYTCNSELGDHHLIVIGTRAECEQAAALARPTLEARGAAELAIRRAQGKERA